MDELKEDKVLAIFAISALFVSVPGSNFGFIAYADDLSENDDREEKQNEKELKEQHKEKTDEQKQLKTELRDEYKIKLEEKKKQFVDFEKELKEKYNTLKNEFKEKYQQLRISKISELKEDTSDNVKSSLSDYEVKKINVCHVPQENSDNAHTINISVNEWQAHMTHGDYWGECDGPDQTDETDEGQNIKNELKEELESHSNEIR